MRTIRLITLAAASAALLTALPAGAKTRVAGGAFRDGAVQDETLLRKGRMEFGISLAGAWARSVVTPEDELKKPTTSTST